jgi:hypothetical protein
MALLLVGIQFVFLEYLQHVLVLVHQVYVFEVFFLCFGIDQDVIQVHHYKLVEVGL